MTVRPKGRTALTSSASKMPDVMPVVGIVKRSLSARDRDNVCAIFDQDSWTDAGRDMLCDEDLAMAVQS